MPRIIWSAPAVADLDRIDAWLTEHRTARFTLDTIRSIRERAQWLGDFPHGGRPTTDGLRIVRIHGTPYLILHQVSGDQVDIVRVHHERQDWQVEI